MRRGCIYSALPLLPICLAIRTPREAAPSMPAENLMGLVESEAKDRKSVSTVCATEPVLHIHWNCD